MKKLCIGATLAFLTFSVVPSTFATDEESRFHGSVGLGGVMIFNGDNLNPRGSEKKINDLSSAADKKLTTLPLILPEATYDVGDPEGLVLFFNTEPPIDEVGGFAFILGASYPTKGFILEMSSFFTPFEETWENPYITGVDRKKTSTTKYGAKIAFNKIAGTGLRINGVYMRDDIDNDTIALTSPSMARDGHIVALNGNYSFQLSESFELRPRISIRNGNYDGDANSFMKYKFDLEARNIVGSMMFISRMYYSYSDFDKVNPIFDKTRNNMSYGASLMANYMAPFSLDNWSLMGLLSYSKGESNIDFYDTEAITIGAFLNYRLP